jgi:hypothetical protein
VIREPRRFVEPFPAINPLIVRVFDAAGVAHSWRIRLKRCCDPAHELRDPK